MNYFFGIEGNNKFPSEQEVPKPVSSTPQVQDAAVSSNESLNTFQDINTAEKQTADPNGADRVGDAIANATKSKDSGAEDNKEKDTLSDERCKELFGSSDLLSAISDINSYRFKYKEGAQEIGDHIGQDIDPTEEHTGVMAQELKANPITESAVKEDPLSGFLTVDTKELTMVEMAILTQMAKRIVALEKEINLIKKE